MKNKVVKDKTMNDKIFNFSIKMKISSLPIFYL